MSRVADLKNKLKFIWESAQEADPDKRAPLMNQWRALEATIAELESKTEKAGDPVDEISARRAARGGSTARPGRAKRGTS